MVGIGYDDFCRLTPEEFRAVCAASAASREALQRDGWERARQLAAISIQPHVRRKITPRQLMPLPWDKAAAAPPVPKGDARARLERVLARKRKGGIPGEAP